MNNQRKSDKFDDDEIQPTKSRTARATSLNFEEKERLVEKNQTKEVIVKKSTPSSKKIGHVFDTYSDSSHRLADYNFNKMTGIEEVTITSQSDHNDKTIMQAKIHEGKSSQKEKVTQEVTV